VDETKEIIEDRINRIKTQIIEYTMKQQEISDKIANLEKDIEIL
jgi:septal ring factor EnvC (AmiA/AmiB activator)